EIDAVYPARQLYGALHPGGAVAYQANRQPVGHGGTRSHHGDAAPGDRASPQQPGPTLWNASRKVVEVGGTRVPFGQVLVEADRGAGKADLTFSPAVDQARRRAGGHVDLDAVVLVLERHVRRVGIRTGPGDGAGPKTVSAVAAGGHISSHEAEP